MAKHIPPEAMIEAGEEFSTFEDLEGLTDDQLSEIAQKCPVSTIDAEACVPCRAYIILYERRQDAGQSSAGPGEDTSLDKAADLSTPSFQKTTEFDFKDEELAKTEEMISLTPVAERFASHVRVLEHLVAEMLEGPPIPPKNVTLEDLAVLTVAAQKWLEMVQGQIQQGFSLSESQQALFHQVGTVVGRMKVHG